MEPVQTAQGLGFGHFLLQTDAVGRSLLLILILMSVASWVLMALKGFAQARQRRRGQAFLSLFWNAGTLDQVRHELQTHGAHDPFSHLAAHALHAQGPPRPPWRHPAGGGWHGQRVHHPHHAQGAGRRNTASGAWSHTAGHGGCPPPSSAC